MEEYIRQHWNTQSVAEIAKHLGVSEYKVRKIADMLDLGYAEREEPNQPSRHEIEKRAAQVRAKWSAEERERREVGVRPGREQRWTVPVIRIHSRA